jgi:hypothetical protein
MAYISKNQPKPNPLGKDSRNQKSNPNNKVLKNKDKKKSLALPKLSVQPDRKGARSQTKQKLIVESVHSKEHNEVKELLGTINKLSKHEDDRPKWDRDHDKYRSAAMGLQGKGYLSPFEHVAISPIQTEVDGGVVSIRFTTTLQAANNGNLTVCFGSTGSKNVATKDVNIIDFQGSVFPFESSDGTCTWLIIANSALEGPDIGDLLRDAEDMDLARSEIMTAILKFGSAIRFLGTGMILKPMGPQGTRTGLLWGSTSGRGGWGSVEGSTTSTEFLDQVRVQNTTNYVQGAVATDYVYSTIWPKSVRDIDYLQTNHLLNGDVVMDKYRNFGSNAVGVLGGNPNDEYLFSFIVHYQIAPANSIFQLIKPVAVKCNTLYIDQMFDAFKTHCENHIFPADQEFDTYRSTIGAAPGHQNLSFIKHYKACPKGILSGTDCVHLNIKDSHPAKVSKDAALITTTQFASAKQILGGISTGIKTVGDIARPLLEVAEIMASLF